ncbi:hypothetical protein pipiens_006083 [Culex pipiens pipiens]|uniref:ZAD domain-containing protein n=1 Tax=Culex pipiens pipiens TaxID=38569 RepID=A0ABD1DRU3_CULPP
MMGRSIAKTRKRNKATKAARAAYARRILQKKQAGDRVPFQRHAGHTLPETATVHILTEPLLEIFKEEPQLEVVESLPDICTNPAESDSIPKVPLFCALCLRKCISGQLAEFATEPSGRDKLALLLGVDIELEQCTICRSCWTMVETFVDFREGCLKASAWRERYPFGLDGAGDDWMSKENLEVMARTRKVV